MYASSRPLVSVVIPVFNGERYLKEAIDSVLQQDYRPIDLIVVDDGSTDGTAHVVQPYASAGQVTRHFQRHQGPAAARNAGVELARGDLVAFIDADDLWVQDKLSAQVDLLLSHPDAEMVLGRMRQFISPDLGPIQRAAARIMREEVLSQLPSSSLIKKSVFGRVGLFDPRYSVAAEMDWVMRALDAGVRMAELQQLVYLRRIHAANIGRRDPPTQDATRLRVLKAGLDRRRAQARRRPGT